MSGPLKGTRVLDLSRVLAGPWATQLLGDYGADVIKVERPESGDDTRGWGPPWLASDDGRESAYFLSTNRNKRSITLDLATPEGQDLVRELVRHADVLVENFRAGTTERWGLDARSLQKDNPGLVYCSISAFARDSSRAGEPGYDAMIQASGGLMSITGAADSEGGAPQKVGVAIADIMCGMYAATAILGALNERERSGVGQAIEVPLFDSQVAWLANQNMNYLVGGEVPARMGTAHPNIVPYQAFPDDSRFRHNRDRLENREALVDLMTAALQRQKSTDWLRELSAAGIPCSPINDLEQVFSSDYARKCGLVQDLEHSYNEKLPTVANPVRFSFSPVSYDRAPPLLGEHTNEVLIDWLGYSDEAIERLRKAGTI
jgi:crotonobetainyl-CoA:carnitine CoA-transferase CaiB-like acyl-CoA transferase